MKIVAMFLETFAWLAQGTCGNFAALADRYVSRYPEVVNFLSAHAIAWLTACGII